MLGLLLRLAILAAALVGVALLVISGAVIAVMLIPVALIAAWMLKKKGVVRWSTVDLRASRHGPRPQGTRAPVIDHDPNDVTIERR